MKILYSGGDQKQTPNNFILLTINTILYLHLTRGEMLLSYIRYLIDGKFVSRVSNRPTKIPKHLLLGHVSPQKFLKIPATHRCQYLPPAKNTTRLPSTTFDTQALPYPKYYHTELLTLDVLKKKQEVGEVEQAELDHYKNIDPCIATHFNRTFNSSWNLPYAGLATSGGLFAFSSYFSFSIPTRIVLTAVPVLIDWLRITRDPINEQHTLDFLNWVVGYRKAKCFSELHRKEFES